MLAFHREWIEYNVFKIQEILYTTMLVPLLFTKQFGWYSNTERIYKRHYMLALSQFMSLPSEECYISLKDI